MIRQLLVATLAVTFCNPAAQAQVREDNDTETISPMPGLADDAERPDIQAVVGQIVEQTNAFRTKEGLSTLEVNEKLVETAQYFADFMARTDQYGHHADEQTPAERASEHDYDYCLIAENIAYQYNSAGFNAVELTRGFFEGWKESPGHRKNMLEPATTETGVAVARSEKTGHYYAVQLFGRPASEQIRYTVTNNSGTAVEYRVGERSYTLPARYSREHRQCSPAELQFLSAAGEAETSFEIEHDAEYSVQSPGKVLVNSEASASAPEAPAESP